MPATLRIIDGPQAGGSRELRAGDRVTLGRGEESDFLVLDSWASRVHCAVVLQDEGVVLEDLSSKNGTYVNGRRIERARLPDGSLIQVGTTTVRVGLTPEAGHPAALPPAPRRLLRAAALVGLSVLVLGGLGYAGIRVFFPGTVGKRSGGILGIVGGKPSSNAIDVGTTPEGATVYIDDEFRGTTPLQGVKLEVGPHALRIVKRGYDVYLGTLNVGRDTAKPIHIELRMAERAAILVNSKPEGASATSRQ
jgi:hypothetical protein